MQKELSDVVLRFFLEDVGGVLITDAEGNVIYEDAGTGFINRENTNWATACPPPREDQRGERWDLLDKDSGMSYMVVTSSFAQNGRLLQLHHVTDSSEYMGLFRDMGDYSKILRQEKEHDGLTGLYNKGKFMSLKRSFFRDRESLAVFNMDVNNLKHMNDSFGHGAGDALICKAAESLRRIEARDVLVFRVGGDEFMAVAVDKSRDEVLRLKETWKAGLDELNARDDGVECVIACGLAYGGKGYDIEELLAEADRLMYADKKAGKAARR